MRYIFSRRGAPQDKLAVTAPSENNVPRGICTACYSRASRNRGSFELPDEDTLEPERTERLLAHPFSWFRSTASDAHLSLSSMALSRATGASMIGVMYDWIAFTVQLILSVLLGLGDALEWGTSAALAQVIAVLGLQVGLGMFLYVFGPGADRFECLVTATQFCLEGTATLMTILDRPGLALYCALLPVFLPIFLSLYDGIFVAVFNRIHSQQKMDRGSCLMAFTTVILSLPSALAAMFGIESSIGDTVLSLVEESCGQSETLAAEMRVD